MVMIPKQVQGKDQSEGDFSDPFGSEIGDSRYFPAVDRRWQGSATGSDSGSGSLASGTFEAIVAEFTACWDRGEITHVEAYLDRMDTAHPTDVVELIYHEFCLAESMGLAPDPTDFLRRFPGREVSLDRLFRLHGALSSTKLRAWSDPEVLPEVGDEIGPYRLQRELGRGSFARVYLAEQADLDNRLVVVKISTRLTLEPRLLARARHSHIVEVLWHGSAEDGALQLICLPFLGGATLATVLSERRRIGRRPKSGRDFLSDLDRVSAPEYPKANLARPAREIVEGLSYPAATAWVVARLAEALDHAFVRGVAHGDIKPSNILLTADGNPMLLDFNLAVGWRLPGASDLPADAGGTLAYMAPERLRAVAESQRLSTPSAADRHRADIFALGVVLLETLTCRAPDLPQAKARTRQEIAAMLAASGQDGDEALRWLARSSVPRGLRSILTRCLAPDRADRYGQAAELADDLDRWRTGRPLAFADEPPWRFRLGRWARRQRLALGAAVLALAVCATAMTMLWYSFQTTLREQAEDKLAMIWDREESGVFRFHRFGHWTPDDQGDPAENARRHLDRYDVIGNPEWPQRDDILSLPEPERSELKLWLLEQVFRYTRALGDRPDSAEDWLRAQTLLDQVIAKSPFGPLRTQRRRLQNLLNSQARTGPTPTPTTASGVVAHVCKSRSPSPRWVEEYLRGVEAEPRRAREALIHYMIMLEERPRSFWGHYRAATVTYRLGDHLAAAAHLRECIAQRPRNVDLRAQLAACLFVMGQYDASLEACTKALEIDPDHAVSTRNQTYVRSRLGQQDRVNSDVRRFELLTRSQREVQTLKVRLESMHFLSLESMTSGPDPMAVNLISPAHDAPASGVLRAAQLRGLNRFDDALLELDKILAVDPEHLEARYYRAMLLRKLERPEAEADFAYLVAHPRLDELIPHYKNAVNIYNHRSTDLLQAGRIAEAIEVARAGLVQANRFATKRENAHYALARAYATAANSNPSLVPRVLDELKRVSALEPKLLANSFEADPYFAGLRDRLRPTLEKRR